MKKLFIFAALTVACACAVAPAFADDYVPSPVGVSLRVGDFYPQLNQTRNTAGDSWLAVGFDYKVSGLKTSLLPPGYFSVSLDYAGKGNFRTAPLLLNYTSGKTLYWSAGAGVSFARFTNDDGTQNDQVRFAYSGAVGFNFSNGQIPLFLEGRYFGKEMNRIGGVGVYLGARF